MGANGLTEYARNTYGATMTDLEAQTFIKKFFEAYSEISQWHKSIQEAPGNESRTVLGRRRTWTERPKLTELLNAPVQGTAADITKKALSTLSEYLSTTGAKIIACVHDEIILEAPQNDLENVNSILWIMMEKAGQVFCKTRSKSGTSALLEEGKINSRINLYKQKIKQIHFGILKERSK
jgi:DNA polymerase-1